VPHKSFREFKLPQSGTAHNLKNGMNKTKYVWLTQPHNLNFNEHRKLHKMNKIQKNTKK